MSQIAYLEAFVGADITSFRRGMSEVRNEITRTTGLGESLQNLGASLTLGLTVPILGVGVAALKTFSDFDSGMRNINSIMQLPEDQLKKLSDQVLKFGENTRNGASAAASALYTIVSAGFGVKNTADAMGLLAVASKTSEAGLADENTVAQLLAQSLLAYGKNSNDAAHFADVLTQTVNLGVGSMDDVAASMGQAINISALAGVTWDQLGGTAAFLTQRGMSFANAFTSINQIVSQLIKPTEGLKAAFVKLGVSSGTELIQKYGSLGDALQALGTVSGTSADDLAKLFTNVRALRGAASILGNFDQYSSLMQEFGSSLNGVTDRAQQQQLKSFASQMDYLKSKVTGFLTSLGQDLAPLVEQLGNFLGNLFDQFNKLDPAVVQNIVSIGLLVAAIGPLIWLVGTLLSPVGLIIAALVVLKTAWDTNFLGIRDSIEQAIPNIQHGFDGFKVILDTVLFYVQYFINNVKIAFDTYFAHDMTQLIHDVIIGNWIRVAQDLGKIWSDIQKLFADKFQMPFNGLVDSVKRKIGELLGSVSPDQFAGILVGVLAIAAVFTAAAIPTAIGAITTAVQGLVAAFLLLNGTALAPFIVIALGIAGLIIAWENNFIGLKDRTNELRQTFENTVTTLKQLLFLFDYYTQGADKAQSDLVSMFGMRTDQTIQPAPGQENNPNVWIDTSIGGSKVHKASPTSAPKISPNYSDIARASGYQSSAYTSTTIYVTTNDPTVLMDKLRQKGIDLGRTKRG